MTRREHQMLRISKYKGQFAVAAILTILGSLVPQKAIAFSLLDTELVVNGDAETGGLDGWISTGVDAVPSSHGLTTGLSDPGETENFVFVGFSGPSDSQTLTQRIDLSSLATEIDNNSIASSFSILLQSRRLEHFFDAVEGTLSFLDGSDTVIESQSFTDTSSISRVYDWEQFADTRSLPSGTRSVEIMLDLHRNGGSSTDAFFDNVSFKLSKKASVPEPGAAFGLLTLGGCGVASLLKRKSKK